MSTIAVEGVIPALQEVEGLIPASQEVEGLEFRVEGLEFRVEGLGLRDGVKDKRKSQAAARQTGSWMLV